MTSGIRRAAGGLLVLEAIWAIYTVYEAPIIVCSTNLCLSPPLNPLYSEVLLMELAAVILLVVGLIGIWGYWLAYPAGAALSALFLLAMGFSAWIEINYAYAVAETYLSLVGAALAAIALLVNLVAWRAKYALSEQANPLNLPVFG
ncbi:MAG TPA: hypothetical protein VGR53_11385 [Nitrososphaerales archaeon]|nr:hypothetical protein [Nitrososphaerales archaeon]